MKSFSSFNLGVMVMVIVSSLLVPTTVFGADNAALFGAVADSTGAGIPNASVSARNMLTGLVQSTTTNGTGEYRFPSLPIGHYSVTASAPNFQIATSTDVLLQVDQQVRLDMLLQIGPNTQTVNVSAQATLVNTADATISTVIDSKRIAELPLNGRNLLQLTLLTPGVRIASSQGFSHPFQPQGNTAVSVSGSGGNSVNYSLDGGDNNYNYNLTANVYPNPDFIQEFTFQTNNIDPEFGRRGGGVVNAVTKSGTNAFHGTLFEYVRNQVFNAHNYFATKGDGLKRNQFGGTIGGPVRIPRIYNGIDKTFFFFGYQRTILRQVPNTLVATVFTGPEKQGDFSQAVNANGSHITIIDPLTSQPFPGNKIPPNRLDPAAQQLLNYLPAATNPAGLIQYKQIQQQNDGQWIGRLDEDLGNKDRLFFRAFIDNYNNPSLGARSNVLTARWPPIVQAATNLIAGWTHTFSPHLLTENSFTFNRQNGGSAFNTDAPTSTDLGVNITDVGGDKALIVGVGSDFNIALDGRVDLISENFNYRNTTSFTFKNQEIRLGADIERLHFDIPRSTYLGDGAFTFGNSYTGNYLTDFLLGYVSRFSQSQGYAELDRETDWGFWGADRIAATKRLTLNLGLRYQPFLPYYDQFHNQNTRFVPGQKSQTYPNLPIGEIAFGDPGVPRRITEGSFNRFSPRIGIAFDPAGDGKTSLRAGWGLFYDSFPMDYTGQFSQEPPYSISISLTNPGPGSFANPYHGNDPFSSSIPFPAPPTYLFPTPFNVYGTEPHFREPIYEQWNVTGERQLLSSNMLVTLSYQGSHGTHLERQVNLNQAIYIPGESSEANLQRRRSYPSFSNILVMRSNSYSDYNAMVLTFERRFSKGVSVLASYLWSKSINDESVGGSNTFQGFGSSSNTNPQDPSIDRSVSDVDVPQRLEASYLWQLPASAAFSRPLRLVLGGWQHNGIITLQSGSPFSVLSGLDNSLSGIGQDRADLLGDPYSQGQPRTTRLTEYFNAAAFGPNAAGTFGDSSRNLLRGPGTINFDMSFFKNFPVTEGALLQFRGEFFNAFNRPPFGNPTNTLSSPQFGRILTAGDPRIVQMALRLTF